LQITFFKDGGSPGYDEDPFENVFFETGSSIFAAMKDRIRLFGITGLFWICFFILCRGIFLIYHFDQTSTLTVREVATILLLGLRMDVAMSGYWLIATGLFLAIPVKNIAPVYVGHTAIFILLLLVSACIVVIDLELYTHWGYRMNRTPLFYFSREAVGSVNPNRLLGIVALFIFLCGLGLLFYSKVIARKFRALKPLPPLLTPVMLLITGCLILPIRSSITVAPLNTGVVYFHKTKSFPNHAGINVVWNFFDSFSDKDDLHYPSDFFKGDARRVLQKMERSADPRPSWLTTPRPNILLIVLESFTANIIEPLGGLKGVTPNLNRFAREGVLFDHFYASGDRTDRGLIAVLSGYPAQPQTSIIRFPAKTQHLPFLSREFLRLGYTPSFVYGGDIGFANMESYLINGGFAHITQDDDFDRKLNHSKWGVADEFVFQRALEECDTSRGSFFKVILSLSSHEPFEVPMKSVYKGDDERSLFLNACYYTDKSLGSFIDQAKQKPWWSNTLVIITADHGHRFPYAKELKEKERFKIPMLWMGGALSKSDTVVHTIAGQTDIANSLLAQLDSTRSRFMFSKNILDRRVDPFAVYIFYNGYGYLDQQNEYVYDFSFKKYLKQKGNPQALANSQAYMQALFDDYNGR
jgi:phosphoglycerol transferase MdoB-like AlkP superfamily enzyme